MSQEINYTQEELFFKELGEAMKGTTDLHVLLNPETNLYYGDGVHTEEIFTATAFNLENEEENRQVEALMDKGFILMERK